MAVINKIKAPNTVNSNGVTYTEFDIGASAENVSYKNNRNVKQVLDDTETHLEDTIYTENPLSNGVHNFRYYNGYLQTKINNQWKIVSNLETGIGDVTNVTTTRSSQDPKLWTIQWVNPTNILYPDAPLGSDPVIELKETKVVINRDHIPQDQNDGNVFETYGGAGVLCTMDYSFDIRQEPYYVRFFPSTDSIGIQTKYTFGTILTIDSSPMKIFVPSFKGGLVYDTLSKNWNISEYWDNLNMNAVEVAGGTQTAINAGNYNITLRLKAGFIWADGTTGNKTIPWSIERCPLWKIPSSGTLADIIMGDIGGDDEFINNNDTIHFSVDYHRYWECYIQGNAFRDKITENFKNILINKGISTESPDLCLYLDWNSISASNFVDISWEDEGYFLYFATNKSYENGTQIISITPKCLDSLSLGDNIDYNYSLSNLNLDVNMPKLKAFASYESLAELSKTIDAYYKKYFTLAEIQDVWDCGDELSFSLSGAEGFYIEDIDANLIISSMQLTIMIIDFDHDILTESINGIDKALITLQLASPLAFTISKGIPFLYPAPSVYVYSGMELGWNKYDESEPLYSKFRRLLNDDGTEFFVRFLTRYDSTIFENLIKTTDHVNVAYNISSNIDSYDIVHTSEKIFLPSLQELNELNHVNNLPTGLKEKLALEGSPYKLFKRFAEYGVYPMSHGLHRTLVFEESDKPYLYAYISNALYPIITPNIGSFQFNLSTSSGTYYCALPITYCM